MNENFFVVKSTEDNTATISIAVNGVTGVIELPWFEIEKCDNLEVVTFNGIRRAFVKRLTFKGRPAVISFPEALQSVLERSAGKLISMRVRDISRVKSMFARDISAFISELELIKSPAHEELLQNEIMVESSKEDSAQYEKELEKLWAVAAKKYDPVATSKSHPGKRLLRRDSDLFSQLGVWENFDCPQRARRELLSAIGNAQQFVSDDCDIPKVVGQGGAPGFMSGRVKFVPVAYADLDEFVPGVSLDMVLFSAMSTDVFKTVRVTTTTLPFTVEEPEIKSNQVKTLLSTPDSIGVFKEWSIATTTEELPSVFKVVTPEGLKGMVRKAKYPIVEKRGEVLREVAFVFSATSVVKKEAQRAILRALASRLEGEYIASKASREQFPEVMEDIRSKLRLQGTEEDSELYRILPGEDMMEVVMINGAARKMTGKLDPILDRNGEIIRSIVGETAIMVMPDNEEFGPVTRNKAFGTGIKISPFMVAGTDKPAPEVDPEEVEDFRRTLELLITLRGK